MDKAEATAKYTSVEWPQKFKERIKPDELKMFKLELHPTRRGDSVEATKRLLRYLAGKDLVTSLEVQEDLGMAEMTVLKRFKVLKKFLFIQRKLNRYYVVTPRLQELVRLYIEHL
jgi:hypothetical protein